LLAAQATCPDFETFATSIIAVCPPVKSEVGPDP